MLQRSLDGILHRHLVGIGVQHGSTAAHLDIRQGAEALSSLLAALILFLASRVREILTFKTA